MNQLWSRSRALQENRPEIVERFSMSGASDYALRFVMRQHRRLRKVPQDSAAAAARCGARELELRPQMRETDHAVTRREHLTLSTVLG